MQYALYTGTTNILGLRPHSHSASNTTNGDAYRMKIDSDSLHNSVHKQCCSISTSQAQIYPLDKASKLISESVDAEGYVHKRKRFFSDSGEFVDVEIVIKNNAETAKPHEEVLPIDAKRRIIAQEKSPDGYIHKLMLVDEYGETREYWIIEKLPQSK